MFRFVPLIALLCFAAPAFSQSSYTDGYRLGHDGHPVGVPTTESSFGRGVQTGRDDAAEDDYREHRRVLDADAANAADAMKELRGLIGDGSDDGDK